MASPELQQIVRAIEIRSPSRFSVEGRPCEVGRSTPPLFTPSRPETTPAATAEEALVRCLTDELYGRWYTRTDAASPLPPDNGAHGEHLARLCSANTSGGTWDPGWSVRAVDHGGVTVGRDGILFLVAPGEVRPSTGRLEPGAACRVWTPAEMQALSPGFYAASGEADRAEPRAVPKLLRFYWHLRPGGASAWVRALTTGLNRRHIPFHLKVVSDPRFYLRADAGVLYLEPEHYQRARPVIRRTYRQVRSDLRPTVPRLTRELAPGLGMAEGAADGESFGGHRCGLIAQALVACCAEGAAASGRIEAVEAAFRSAGIDPSQPFRAPESTSRYRSLPSSDLRPPAPAPSRGVSGTDRGATSMIEVAARIGDALCKSAHRLDSRCNWVGRAFAPDPKSGGFVEAAGALGADLYGGTSGIGLFLAELSGRTGEQVHRRTALAAVRQALQSIDSEPQLIRPLAFFEGHLGVAWAARRVAALTDCEELADRSGSLVSELVRRLPGDRRQDLLEGSAGAILALLRLHEEGEVTGCLEAACELGRELLRQGGNGGGGTPTAAAPLTGFAHGAAGVGLALLELHAVTGDADLRAGADAYFAYEEARFDASLGNWPDLRGVPVDTSGTLGAPPNFMTAWCHGASGIALSRLRAMEVDPENSEKYESAARAGLATTVAKIEADLASLDSDESLCHGVSGLADVLWIAGQVLGDETLTAAARTSMERLAARVDKRGGSASGSGRLPDPSLFTGEAGVGYALLRFDAPERVATALLPAARSAG